LKVAGRTVPTALVRAGQLALTVLVTWFILDRVGLSLAELGRVDLSRWRVRWGLLAASCVVLAAGYGFSCVLWGRMVRTLGGPPVPPWTAVRVFMLANLGRYVPGKVLQIAGLAYLARRAGVRPAVATGAALLGQGMALLGATLVGLGAFFGATEAWRPWGWAGLAAVAALVFLTSLPGPAAALEHAWFRLANALSKGPGVDDEEPDEPAKASLRGFGLRWTLLYAANWSMHAVAFWLLFLSLEGWTTFLSVGPAFAAAYVAGWVAIFAPAGVGVREGALILFLSPVLAPEPAAALAVAARLWTTAVELLPAALFALLHLRGNPDPASSARDPGKGA
jgi:hypothetical protein